MKLFLSSYRAGQHSAALLELLDGVQKVGVISNAKDYHIPKRRAQRMDEVYDFFSSLGVVPSEVDLRPFFNQQGIEQELEKYNFIWLAGGNVFLLRRALEYSGAANCIIKNLKEGSIILGGESAGALILGPTLKGVEMESDSDSPNFIPEYYNSEILWQGLRVVDFIPVPHYGSEDYGDEMKKYIKHLDQSKIPYKKMTDSQAIRVIDGKEEFLA